MNNEIVLNDKEIDFIRYTIIHTDLTNQKTREYFSWRSSLEFKVFSKQANKNEEFQYNRLREIENFTNLLSDNGIPETIEEIIERSDDQIIDNIEKDFYLKVLLQENWVEMENSIYLEQLKEYFVEQEEQDLDEPFIQDFINKLQYNFKESQKYDGMYAMIQNINFEYLNKNDLAMICLNIFRELNNPEDKTIRRNIRELDKKMLVYLILRFGFDFSKTNDGSNKQIK